MENFRKASSKYNPHNKTTKFWVYPTTESENHLESSIFYHCSEKVKNKVAGWWD